MTCAACGAENRSGRKFCAECGTALAVGCPSCGAANEPGEKFCGECGATLASDGAPERASSASAPVSAERRLVSVLFVDLVGFTTASEARDAEDTRELLSRYFDICRRLITLYGGTVEKFIGDAVMAVWGTPVAHRGRRRARGPRRRSTSSQRCRRSGTRSAPRSCARGPACSPARRP